MYSPFAYGFAIAVVELPFLAAQARLRVLYGWSPVLRLHRTKGLSSAPALVARPAHAGPQGLARNTRRTPAPPPTQALLFVPIVYFAAKFTLNALDVLFFFTMFLLCVTVRATHGGD